MDMLRLFAVSATISTVLVLVLALLSLPPAPAAPAAPAAQSDLSGYVERHYVAVLEVGKYPRPH